MTDTTDTTDTTETLRIHTIVQPGGKVEFVCPELEPGQSVDVVVSRSAEDGSPAQGADGDARPRRSLLDILNEAPGHLLFKTAEEVDEYIREERDSW